jgi:hypothetical protein
MVIVWPLYFRARIMQPREVDKREFIPAGRKSTATASHAGMSARRIAGLAIPFVASVLATMTVVLVGGSFVTGKQLVSDKVMGVPLARSKHVSDDPKANPSWLAGGAPDWVTQALGGLFKGVGGTPAIAAAGDRPVMGRVATFALLPLASKPPAPTEPVAETPTPAPAAETARSTRDGAKTPGPDARKTAQKNHDAKTKTATKPATQPRVATAAPQTPAATEQETPRASAVATLGKPATGATSVGGMTPAEQSVANAIRVARADFRLTDVAVEQLRKLVSAMPNLASRPSFESQVGELSATLSAVIGERTRFDLFTDFFATPDIGAYGETAIRSCLSHVPEVASSQIARKSVLIQAAIPAYFVLVDAPSANADRSSVETSVSQCLAPLKTAGTVSLLLNVRDPDTRALTAAMTSVVRPFSYAAIGQQAAASGAH